MSDIGFFRAGDRVWFRGQHATGFTVRGVIEEVIPVVEHSQIIGVHKYGVRLENGNYKLCEINQVRERGFERTDTHLHRSLIMRPMRHDDPPGTPVSVVMDDQTIVRTKTRSETWTVGGSHQVVLLEGRTGGYLVKRCSVLEPGDF